nr:FtsW/RodA/SpoVE family cell cycle protein [Actinomycetota bacterium]
MQATWRRNSEMRLLLMTLIVGTGALALVALARNVASVSLAAPLMAVMTATYVTAHIAMRRLAPQADPLLLPLSAILNVLGLAAVYRLDPKGFGPTQVTWTAVGVACFIGVLVVLKDHQTLSRYKYIFGFLGVVLLMIPATPLGTEINGAKLWVRLGPFSFQPGELAKISLVIFLAAYLAERKELLAIASKQVMGFHVPDLKHFGPLLVMWGLSLAVMFYEKDLGSSLLFFSIFLVMLYIATARVVYVAFGTALFMVGAFAGYRIFEHVQVRVKTWIDVFNPKYIQDEGFQLAQSLFALATGGLFGTGLGQGRPDIIPAAETDFIFSVIGEELGLL